MALTRDKGSVMDAAMMSTPFKLSRGSGSWLQTTETRIVI